MSISISNSESASAVAALSQVTSQAPTQDTDDVAAPRSDSTKVSKPAELLSKLSQLKQSDPAKFKAVMKDLSDKLAAAADSAGDTKLKDLADKLAKAGESGDLSSLKPPSRGAGGPHRGHGGGGHGKPPPAVESFMSSALSEVDDALGTSSTTTTTA